MDSELSPYFYALRSNEEGRSVCGIVSCAPEQDTGIPERFLAAAARFPEAWEEAPEPLSKSVEHVSHQITALPDGPLLSSEQMQPVLLTLRKILAGLEPSVRMDVPESFLLADNPSAAAVRQKLRSIISSLQTSTVPDSDVSQIAQIQLYIAQNFESPEFSVGRLADQFSMPVSTLSSFFRGQTGESLDRKSVV